MPDLRVSDQDRDLVAQQLRDHFAAGRITEDELNERVQCAYVAKTQQQLDSLLSDLPALPITRQQLRTELVQRRRDLRRRLVQEAGGSATPFIICTIIWVATGASGSFWPIWVAIPLILMLVRNGWLLYGPNPDVDRVERYLERRSRGDRRRQRDQRRLG